MEKYPDWQLEIYGSESGDLALQQLVVDYHLESNVNFYEPVKNIHEKYQESSMCLMTSRSEGFPMVILEAMSFGLPVVAFDCPIGPRVLIENNYNVFLIPNGDINFFANKITELIENKKIALTIGFNANKSAEKYDIKPIMQLWQEFFLNVEKLTIKI